MQLELVVRLLGLLILIDQLVSCLEQINQDLQQKNIYQDVADYHERGQWQGYIFHYTLGGQNIITQPEIMTLNSQKLLILDQEYKTENFRFTCDSLSKAPCSFDKFYQIYRFLFKQFTKNAFDFIKSAGIGRRSDQCIVVEVVSDSQETETDNQTGLHLICTYVQDQMSSLKVAFKLAFQNRMKEIPLGERVNFVNFDEEFDVLYSNNDYFVYKTSIFTKKDKLVDREFNDLVQLKSFKNYEGQICKVDYPPPKLFKAVEGQTEKYCCLSFLYNSKNDQWNLWNICSLFTGDCVVPIKGLGNFMQQQCNRMNRIIDKPSDFFSGIVNPIPQSSYQQYADNELYNLVVTDGDTTMRGKFQLQSTRLVNYNNQIVIFNYNQIQLINNKPCAVLSRIDNSLKQVTQNTINLPIKINKILNNKFADTCCLSLNLLGKMLFVCIEKGQQMCDPFDEELMRLQNSLISRCQAERFKSSVIENYHNIDFNQFIENKSSQGIWKGYAKMIKVTGQIPIQISPQYLSISGPQQVVYIYKDHKQDEVIEQLDLLGLDWICDDNEYPCLVDDYVAKKANTYIDIELANAVQLAMKSIQAESFKDCMIIEFRSISNYLNSEKIGLLICPYSKNQIPEIQKAIKKAYEDTIDSETNGLTGQNGAFAPEGFEFMMSFQALTGNKELDEKNVISSKVHLNPQGPLALPNYNFLFKYEKIEKLNNVICGFEYGNELKITKVLAQESKPECCFSFILQTRRKSYICVKEAIRCHQKSLMIMKRMRGDCLKALAEKGLIDIRQYKKDLEQIEFVGITKEQNIKLPTKFSYIDPMLKLDFKKNFWQGSILFKEIDMDGDLQQQGEQIKVTSPKYIKAFLSIDEKSQKIKVAKNIDLLDMDSDTYFSFNIRRVFFQCAYEQLCFINSYLKSKTILGTISQQQQLLQNNLREQVQDFMNNLPNGQSESNCFVLENEGPIFRALNGYFICTVDTNQGPILRQIITNMYIKINSYIEITNGYDKKGLDHIPKVTPIDMFNIKVMEEKSDISIALKVMALKDRLKWLINDNVVINFNEIQDCHIQQKLNSAWQRQKLTNIGPDIENDCCIEMKTFQRIIICVDDNLVQCLRNKMMLVKHIHFQCKALAEKIVNTKDVNKNIVMSGSGKANAPIISDEFDFGLTPEGVLVTEELDIDQLRKDCLTDPQNGLWEGWVFMRVITDRFRVSCPLDTPMYSFYLKLNTSDVIFFKDKSQKQIAYNFQTCQQKFTCADSKNDNICKPIGYMKVHSPENKVKTNYDINYYDIVELEEGIRKFLRVLPTGESEDGCIVLESVDPTIRKINSYLLCTVAPEQISDLEVSIKRAYYQSILTEKIMNVAPTPGFYFEKFTIYLWEEMKVVQTDIVFTKDGMAKFFGKKIDNLTPKSDIKLLFKYNDIAQDNQNNNCAFFYRGRIKLPPQMEELNIDSNCCFSFKNKRGFSVFICADSIYLKCLRDSRMILKKMLLGCLLASRGTAKSKFESLNGELPKSEIDNYQKVLFDDSRNGVWKGLIYWKELLKNEGNSAGDKLESNTPVFCKIEDGQIQIFRSETEQNSTPLKVIYIQGIQFDCDEDRFTCTINSFANIYQKYVEPGEDLAREKYFKQVDEVSGLLPIMNDKQACCTVIRVKINTIDPNNQYELHTICTRLEEQGTSIKRAINKQFEMIVNKANVITGVPNPTFKQIFKLQMYKEKMKKVVFLKTVLGPQGLNDGDSGRTIIGFNEIQGDDYGTKCAIWFRGSSLTLPALLRQFVYNIKCCFKLIQVDQQVFICMDKKYHCLLETRQLIKSLKLGCQSVDVTDGTGKLELGGDDQFQISETVQSDMKTKLLGQQNKQKTAKVVQQLSSIFKHTGQDELYVNVDEDGQHNKHAEIQGYVLEGILPNSQDQKMDPREVYMEMDYTGLNIYLNKGDDFQEKFEMADLMWPCDSEFPCSPDEFREKMKTKIQVIGGEQMNEKITMLRQFYNMTLKYFSSNFEITQRCVGLEFTKVKYNKPEQPAGDESQKRIICVIQDPAPRGSKNNLDEYYDKFKLAFTGAFNIAYSKLPFDKVHGLQKSEYKILFKSADHLNLYYGPQNILTSIGERGLENKHDKFFDYLDPDDCQLCYYLPDNVVPDSSNIKDRDCCIQYYKKGEMGFLCIQSQFRCFYDTRTLVKFLYNQCKNQKLTGASPPVYCIQEIVQPYFVTNQQALPSFKQIKSGTRVDLSNGTLDLDSYQQKQIDDLKQAYLDNQKEVESNELRIKSILRNRKNSQVQLEIQKQQFQVDTHEDYKTDDRQENDRQEHDNSDGYNQHSQLVIQNDRASNSDINKNQSQSQNVMASLLSHDNYQDTKQLENQWVDGQKQQQVNKILDLDDGQQDSKKLQNEWTKRQSQQQKQKRTVKKSISKTFPQKIYQLCIEKYRNFNNRLIRYSKVKKLEQEQMNDQTVIYNSDGSVGIKYPNNDYVVSDTQNQQVFSFKNNNTELMIKDLSNNNTFRQNMQKKISLNFQQQFLESSVNITFSFWKNVFKVNGTVDDESVKYFYDQDGNYLDDM